MTQLVVAIQRHPAQALGMYLLVSLVLVLFISVAGLVLLIALRNLAFGLFRPVEKGSMRWMIRPRPVMLGSGLVMLVLAGLAFTTVPLGAIFYMVGT